MRPIRLQVIGMSGLGSTPEQHMALAADAQRTAEAHLDFMSQAASCDEALNTLMHARASVAAMVEHRSAIANNYLSVKVDREFSRDMQRTFDRFSKYVEQFRRRCLSR